MWFRKRKKNKGNTIPVSVLIEQFNDTVKSVQQRLNNYQLNRLDQFFNTDGSPITKRLQSAEGSYIEIPLLSLVNHRCLYLAEFTIVFDADINLVNTEKVKQQTQEMEKNGLTIEFPDNPKNKDTISIKLSYENGMENILSKAERKSPFLDMKNIACN